ncbi:hypothetical protein Aeqsu_0982 [Aequorivita sublithincola DSM 14238]|uniref:Lipoprotein n=1 Tax=Aequorivita sublithincola (strain DSM 14238 / LMG 21431 / ACAM 643 / 9-3) TaxID=746697 RepID=I3YU15_AEQSU|nr:hypothetical protein [Aequorivita sublithincola]AFL80483.1 hypothetical protein Aeqsu_0982 [Aequorivita sublithincola DSM 14238]
MKNTLVLLILLALVSCNNSKKETQTNLDQQSDFEVEYLEGYFPKNDIEFDAEVKALVIANQTDFDKYFGIAQTMNNKVPAIDFEKNKVAAIISAPSDKKQQIVITGTDLKNNKLIVKYKLKVGEDAQSFTSTDQKMFPIPKSVYAVDFVIDRDDSKTNKKQ